MLLYAIFDKVSCFWSGISTHPNDDTAMRAIAQQLSASAKDSMLRSNAEDFDLYQIASFDEFTGFVTTVDDVEKARRFVVNFASLIKE